MVLYSRDFVLCLTVLRCRRGRREPLGLEIAREARGVSESSLITLQEVTYIPRLNSTVVAGAREERVRISKK